jgi:two-component system LytT family response regulator
MLRAIIIDDEQKGINSLRLLIEKFIHNVKVVAETTDPLKAKDLIEDYKPEIVFLDINMPHLNGFEVLKGLNFKDFNLVFTTAHREHALQAIKNNALDYLLKPIDINDLRFAINKIVDKLTSKDNFSDDLKKFLEVNVENKSRLTINTKDGVDYVCISDIIRLEADSNYTFIYTVQGARIVVSKTLKEFESILCNGKNEFMRVHQSHIVNLRYVAKFIKDASVIIMKNEDKVPVSKNKKDEFLNWLSK